VLEELKKCNKTVGVKQTIRAVESGNAKTVFIAKDAEAKVVNNLKELCENKSVTVVYAETMKQLGKACGIEVGASAAALIE
jgi:large subunit ribosomal protein L7A